MNKYRALIAIMASCCCSSAVFGENLIRSLLNKVSKPSNVVTNLPKQDLGGGLYYYKIGTTASDPELSALLKRNKELRARNAALGLNDVTEETDTGHVPMTPSEIETARIAIAAQKQSAHSNRLSASALGSSRGICSSWCNTNLSHTQGTLITNTKS